MTLREKFRWVDLNWRIYPFEWELVILREINETYNKLLNGISKYQL